MAAALPYPLVATTKPLAPARRHRRPNVASWVSGEHICAYFGAPTRRRWRSPITTTPMANKVIIPFAFPKEEEVEQISVLTNIRSAFNDIVMVDTPNSRLLLLDSTNNISSIINKDEKFTGSYWDEFATLPAIIPQGPIAILGLGAGTAARLMLDLWPSLHLEGWEIDDILVDKAREYFGLSDLEKHTDSGGFLSINIGDALSPTGNIEGRFAGMVVDLFCDGDVLPQLNQVETLLELQKRLMPHGCMMVNCGGKDNNTSADATSSPEDSWMQNSTIKALCEAFPGKLWWKEEGCNYLAFTGPEPDFDSWSTAVPIQLSSKVKQWKGL